MRDAEKTIGNLIDKQGISFIASTVIERFSRIVNSKARLNQNLKPM